MVSVVTSLSFIICTSPNLDIPCHCCVCSASSVTRSHVRPILHSALFHSPEKPFLLPIYAETVAQEFAHSLSPAYDSRGYSGNHRVLDFLDISADECNDELEDHSVDDSDDNSSSMSPSVPATSCSSSPSSTSNIVSRS
jgi:hypothetical protein